MTSARGRLGTLLTVLSLAISSPAVGQTAPAPTRENEAIARHHFDRGSKLYEQGKYLDAAREFQAGYESAPRPLFLLNIGHSYRRAQELRKAKAAYEKLLRTDPTTPHRPVVEDLIRTIDDALNVQELDLTIPPKNAASPMSPAGFAPGARTNEPPGGSTPNLFGSPETPAPPPENPSTSSSWLRSPWLWGIVAGVVTAGVAGTVFVLTRSPPCPANACWKEP